jgi:cyclopropane fatty-acyl-phospholipid synthase-like methyltransferase
MRTLYEGFSYSESNPTWHEEDSPWKANHIGNIIDDNAVPHHRICEVGCGVGNILLNLEKRYPDSELVGYEISPFAYAKAKEHETAATKFHLEDVTQVPDFKADVLLAIDVMEHVEDYVAFLKAIRPLATHKIFHIPLDLSVQSIFRVSPIMGQRRDVGHIHYFFKDSALATLTDAGYTIVDHRYTASRLELPNQSWSSRWMRWPRRLLYALSPDFAARVVGGYSLLVLAK